MPDPDMTPLCEATLEQIKDELRRRYQAGVFALDEGPEEMLVYNAWPTWQRALGLVRGLDIICQVKFLACREMDADAEEEVP
mgnify:FL=1